MDRPTHWKPAPEAGDEALLAQYRADPSAEAGRRAAGQLLARYRGRVYAWAYRLLREHEDALDVSQAVLLKAWRALPDFDGRSRFSSWLFAVTRNECLAALRPRILVRDESADPIDLLVDESDPVCLLERAEEEAAVDALLREVLSPLEQQALWLRCYEGLPVDEITRMLELTHASGARSVLQSAREKLRKTLALRRATGGGP